MASFFEDALKKSEGKTPCKVRDIVEQFDEQDREEFEQAMNDDRIKASHIAGVLQERKFRISERTVQRHCAKVCSCFKNLEDEDE